MIFIDSGPFIARYLTQDQFHARAVTGFNKLARTKVKCFTSNFVLDELFTLLGRRADYGFAAEKARLIYASRQLEIIRPEEGTELKAIELLEKYADQKVSFTDCISFALIKEHKLKQVFSFDAHFSRAGFQVF